MLYAEHCAFQPCPPVGQQNRRRTLGRAGFSFNFRSTLHDLLPCGKLRSLSNHCGFATRISVGRALSQTTSAPPHLGASSSSKSKTTFVSKYLRRCLNFTFSSAFPFYFRTFSSQSRTVSTFLSRSTAKHSTPQHNMHRRFPSSIPSLAQPSAYHSQALQDGLQEPRRLRKR